MIKPSQDVLWKNKKKCYMHKYQFENILLESL